MKLTFTFSDSPDLNNLSKFDGFNTSFDVPDDALHLIGVKERVLTIADSVGQLTQSALHISCKELELKNHPVKLEANTVEGGLFTTSRVFVLYFQRFDARTKQKQLKILLPVRTFAPQPYFVSKRRKSLKFSVIQLTVGDKWAKSEDDQRQYAAMTSLAEQCLVLLNADSTTSPSSGWHCLGFHPSWTDNTLINQQNNRSKLYRAEQRKQEREAKKRQEAEAKRALKLAEQPIPLLPTSDLPKTGAGRRPGAIPGIFKGVQFRSQLEIRFATELESRNIRWVYEAERLGEGQYLVDFYLPDFSCWVEVKGRFEPRDEYLIKDVATYLKRERNQQLFVYTQSKIFEVSSDNFALLDRNTFWKTFLP